MADDIARLGYEIDSSQALAAEANLDRMNAAAGRVVGGTDKIAKSTSSMSGGLRNFAQQMNQVGQQTAATGNFVQALAIQLPDLMLGFGTLGIALGAVAPLVLSLGANLFDASTDAEELRRMSDDLSDSIDGLGDAVSNARRTLGDLTMEFGSLADEMQIAFNIMERARIRDIEADFRNISSAVTDQVGTLDLAKQSLRGFTGERAEVEAIADIFGITVGHAYNLMENLNAVENAADFEDMASKAADLLAIIEATEGPVESLDGPFAIVADRLAELVRLAGQYRAEAEATVDAVGNAIPSGVDPGIRPQMRPMDLGDTGPTRAGARRGANRAAQLAKQRERELETLISSLMTERETIDAWQKEQLEQLKQYNDAELQEIGGKEEAKNRILQEAADKRAAIVQGERDRSLGIYSDLMGNMASLAQAGGEKTFAVWKAFSIAQATIDSYRAYTQVLADPFFIGRPFMRAIAAGSVLAGGLAQVANIASTNIGGGGGGKGSSAAATTGSSAASASPERVVRIDLLGGTARDREFAESIISQIYEASEDGARVIVAR